jgi:putative phage-type endonuclease
MKSDQFHEERKTGIGGSDIAVIMGISPFGKTTEDVWRDKLGLSMLSGSTGPMKRGTRLESIAIEEYANATGREIATGELLYRHPLHRHMIAHLDGQIMDEAGQWSGVLEVKIPNVSTFMRYRREGVGDYINIQLQHYLAVTGRPWGSIYIWSPEVWEGFHIDAKPDTAIIDLIYSKADAFWQCVESKTPPPLAGPPQIFDFPKHEGAIVQIDSDDWKRAASDLKLATDLMKEAEHILERSKARVKDLMAGLDAAEGYGVRCYNKWSEGRRTVDKKAAVSEILRLRKIIDSIAPGSHPWSGPPEDIITKIGKPFTTFRSYFIANHSQIEE